MKPCPYGCWRPIPDIALNHQGTQGTLGDIVDGFDAPVLQESPEAIGYSQQLMAGADRFGPRRLRAALVAQLDHPLRYGHNRLTVRHAGWFHCGPVDCSFFVAMPWDRQLLLHGKQ